MEINPAKTVEYTVSDLVAQSSDIFSVVPSAKLESEKSKVQPDDTANKEKELTKDELSKINVALNDFMSAINSDIHFKLHDKTQELMLQVVDTRNNKVLREIPSHEMLDVIAKIREYVGAILDKRA